MMSVKRGIDFPRGKKEAPPSTKKPDSDSKTPSRKRKLVAPDFLTDKSSSKKKQYGKKGKNDEEEEEKVKPIETLTYQNVEVGTHTLVRVVKIKESEIVVSLPGRVMGVIPLTDISEPYTKALSQLAKTGKSHHTIYPLFEMFSIGQLLPATLSKVGKSSEKTQLLLSLSPNLLHANLSWSGVGVGTVLRCALESREDHGYIVLTGIKNTTGFLPLKDYEEFKGVGEIIPMRVVSLTSSGSGSSGRSFLTLSINPSPIQKTTFDLNLGATGTSFILPGLKLASSIVTKVHKSGVWVDLGGEDVIGFIHVDHLGPKYSSPLEVPLGTSLSPTVLYKLPNESSIALSLLISTSSPTQSGGTNNKRRVVLGCSYDLRITRWDGRGLWGIIKTEGTTPPTGPKGGGGKRGGVNNNTKGGGVNNSVKGGGVNNSVNGGGGVNNNVGGGGVCRAFVSMGRVGVGGKSRKELEEEFKIGSTLKCLVEKYAPMDEVYIASFLPSSVSKGSSPGWSGTVGEIVSCKIFKWTTNIEGSLTGASVQIGKNKEIGFIPLTHFNKITKVQTLFPIGTKLKGRIFSSGLSKLSGVPIVTLKKEIVRGGEFKILSSNKDMCLGDISIGIIVHILPQQLVMRTMGGAKGFVPLPFATREKATDLTEMFKIGQVFKLKVIRASPERTSAIFSLNLSEAEKMGEKTSLNDNGQKSENGKKLAKKEEKKKELTAEELLVLRKKIRAEKKLKIKAVKLKKAAKKAKNAQNSDSEVKCLTIPNDKFYNLEVVENPNKKLKIETIENCECDYHKTETKTPKNLNNKKVKNEKVGKNGVEDLRDFRLIENVETYEDFEILVQNKGENWPDFIKKITLVHNIVNVRESVKLGLLSLPHHNERAKEALWKLLFSFEQKYGTKESLETVFNEALACADSNSICKSMLQVISRSSNINDFKDVFERVLKREGSDDEVWKIGLSYFYKNGELESGRSYYYRSLKHILKHKHVGMTSHVGILEMRHGDPEISTSLFDTLLFNYQKRLDIWIIYAEQSAKCGRISQALNIIERGISLNCWNETRKNVLLKKLMDIQMMNGTTQN